MNYWLELLAQFDLISRLDELIFKLTHSGYHTFHVRRDCLSGEDIQGFLRNYGVRIWGTGTTLPNPLTGDPGCFYFTVAPQHVNWTEYLLLRNGLPVVSQIVNPQNRYYAARYSPGSAPPQSRSGRRTDPATASRPDQLLSPLNKLLSLLVKSLLP